MTDTFENHAAGLTSPAYRHFAITPSDSEDLAVRPRALYVTVDGAVSIVDEAGTTLTYAVTVGTILPLRAVRVRATGTTATVIGWY